MRFDADDSLLELANAAGLQKDLYQVVDFFAMFGLKPNQVKTKFIMVQGAQAPLSQETTVYN